MHSANKLIGLSVSRCIADIIAERVQARNVVKIIGGTCAGKPEDWDAVIDSYKWFHWKQDPELGEEILRKFISRDQIFQPRLVGLLPPDTTRTGHWMPAAFHTLLTHPESGLSRNLWSEESLTHSASIADQR